MAPPPLRRLGTGGGGGGQGMGTTGCQPHPGCGVTSSAVHDITTHTTASWPALGTAHGARVTGAPPLPAPMAGVPQEHSPPPQNGHCPGCPPWAGTPVTVSVLGTSRWPPRAGWGRVCPLHVSRGLDVLGGGGRQRGHPAGTCPGRGQPCPHQGAGGDMEAAAAAVGSAQGTPGPPWTHRDGGALRIPLGPPREPPAPLREQEEHPPGRPGTPPRHPPIAPAPPSRQGCAHATPPTPCYATRATRAVPPVPSPRRRRTRALLCSLTLPQASSFQTLLRQQARLEVLARRVTLLEAIIWPGNRAAFPPPPPPRMSWARRGTPPPPPRTHTPSTGEGVEHRGGWSPWEQVPGAPPGSRETVEVLLD